MAFEVNIPKLGMTMSEAKIVKWVVREGEKVEKGKIILTIETEKINWEVEAVASGLLHILVQEGNVAEVGAIVGLIAESEEELAKIQKEAPTPGGTRGAATPQEGLAPVSADAISKKEAVPSTPAARRLAKELGVELSMVTGTGPGGRITEADVTKFHQEGPPLPKMTPVAQEMARQAGLDPSRIAGIVGTGEGGKITKEDVKRALEPIRPEEGVKGVRSVPFSGMRKAIAKNMYDSLHNTAQVTTFVEADVTETVHYLKTVREHFKNDATVRISYNDIMILMTSRVLKQFPVMNSTVAGEQILLHDSVNMGIAVALDEGLIVPVLRDADKKGLLQISRESRELIQKAREGRLSVDDVTGGTFTVSNIGVFDVDGGTPILNRPQTGILAVGRIIEKPAVYKGEICIRSMMFLNLTFDHRVVDGAPSSQFLKTVVQYLNNPILVMS
jgi:pyruvate dehydrogenase E2 component (dihydrolipoamide acetyltransferase)